MQLSRCLTKSAEEKIFQKLRKSINVNITKIPVTLSFLYNIGINVNIRRYEEHKRASGAVWDAQLSSQSI